MSPLMTKKTLCLFDVDLPNAELPPCEVRMEVTYPILDTAAWAQQPNKGHITDRHLFQARLDRGEQFWTAQQDDRIVSYIWATKASVEIGEIYAVVRPREDEIYLYDAFTFDAYRGRNLYPAVLQQILVHGRKTGLRRALIFVLSDNIASIRGVKKAGFKEFQRVTYSTTFGFGRYRYKPRLSPDEGVDMQAI